MKQKVPMCHQMKIHADDYGPGIGRHTDTCLPISHPADGNFHFGYWIDPNNPQECDTAEALNPLWVSRALR